MSIYIGTTVGPCARMTCCRPMAPPAQPPAANTRTTRVGQHQLRVLDYVFSSVDRVHFPHPGVEKHKAGKERSGPTTKHRHQQD